MQCDRKLRYAVFDCARENQNKIKNSGQMKKEKISCRRRKQNKIITIKIYIHSHMSHSTVRDSIIDVCVCEAI